MLGARLGPDKVERWLMDKNELVVPSKVNLIGDILQVGHLTQHVEGVVFARRICVRVPVGVPSMVCDHIANEANEARWCGQETTVRPLPRRKK